MVLWWGNNQLHLNTIVAGTNTMILLKLNNSVAGTNAVQLQRAMSGVGVDVIMPGRRAVHANGRSAGISH